MKLFFIFLIITQLSVGLLSAEEIKVVTEDWAPYNYEKGGKITGIGTQIVRATLTKAGIKAKIKIYPWARAYKIAIEEKNVLIYTIVRNEEREKLFKWIGPFAPRNLSLFRLKKRNDIIINKIEDAREFKIGVVRDDVTHQFFQNNKYSRIYPVSNRKSKIRMLLVGRVDLISGNEFALAFKMKLMGVQFSRVEKAFTITQTGGYYMAFNKTTEDIVVDQVREALVELQKEGKIQKILDNF